MTFMRSNSGIRNYALFRGASITVYIEGKRTEGDKRKNGMQRTFDEVFYSSILRQVIPNISFSLKVVGSKSDVLAYARAICADNIGNAFTIIDKDYDGIMSSALENAKIVRTKGYSWENDFWSRKLCLAILNSLTLRPPSGGRLAFYRTLSSYGHRLSRISKIDLLTKIHGIKYIPSTDTSVGLNMVKSKKFGISARSIVKLKKSIGNHRQAIRQCPIVQGIASNISKVPQQQLIRGHLWEHVCIHAIGDAYKEITGEKTIPNTVIKHLGFDKFSAAPKTHLEKETFAYYSSKLQAAATAALAV